MGEQGVVSSVGPAVVEIDGGEFPAARDKVLLLRTCDATMRSHGGFQWPCEVGADVAAPDWSPTASCGHGLHGLLWGEGDAGLLSRADDARWLVVEADAASVVDLVGKVKVPSCTIAFIGAREDAVAYLVERAPGRAVCFAEITAGDGGTATAGDGGTATAGDGGTATAGYGGTATAGDGGEIRVRWWDGANSRYRTVIGYIGEDGLVAGTRYRLNAQHAFEEAT